MKIRGKSKVKNCDTELIITGKMLLYLENIATTYEEIKFLSVLNIIFEAVSRDKYSYQSLKYKAKKFRNLKPYYIGGYANLILSEKAKRDLQYHLLGYQALIKVNHNLSIKVNTEFFRLLQLFYPGRVMNLKHRLYSYVYSNLLNKEIFNKIYDEGPFESMGLIDYAMVNSGLVEQSLLKTFIEMYGLENLNKDTPYRHKQLITQVERYTQRIKQELKIR